MACRPRREENIGIKFTRRALDAVAKVLDERRSSCSVETTGRGKNQYP